MSILIGNRHQETGVRFVLMREDESLSKRLSTKVCNATGAQYYEQEEGCTALGGLIADVMGLGKTLTTLVSILRSSDKAREFAYSAPVLNSLKGEVSRMKATLVVVPSARKSEARSHFH